MSLRVQGKNILFNGEAQDFILGRTSFKFLGHVHAGNIEGARNWIEHNQRIGVSLLRVLGETHYWQGHQMFGSPPRIDNVWDWGSLENGHRPTSIENNNRKILDALYNLSQETGMAFEYVVDATMKHAAPDIPWGTIGHCIRQTLRASLELEDKYPNALVMFNFHNEWDAHSDGSWRRQYGDVPNRRDLALAEVNQQARRARRWKRGEETVVSFNSPGSGWSPEQNPGATILLDHGGRDTIQYNTGTGPNEYPIIALHPSRSGEWWNHTNRDYLQYLNGPVPVYFSESKMYVDPVDRERALEWYPREVGWTTDLDKYMQFLDGAKELGIHFCIHDEKGIGTQSDWPREETPLESELLGRGGSPPLPPAPPEPPPGPVPPTPPPSDGWELVFQDDYVLLYRHNNDSPPPLPPGPDMPPPDDTSGGGDEPIPEDYVHKARVPDLLQMLDEVIDIWYDIRNPTYAAVNCADLIDKGDSPKFPMSAEAILAHSRYATQLMDERDALVDNLQRTNRRSQTSEDRWSQRTEVRKTVLKSLVGRLQDSRAVVDSLHEALLGQPGHGTLYDNIRGWCEYSHRTQ